MLWDQVAILVWVPPKMYRSNFCGLLFIHKMKMIILNSKVALNVSNNSSDAWPRVFIFFLLDVNRSLTWFSAFFLIPDLQLDLGAGLSPTWLSFTTGWRRHYSDGDCLTNKHFHSTSTGSSQCCPGLVKDTLFMGSQWTALTKVTPLLNALQLYWKNQPTLQRANKYLNLWD